MHAVATLYLVSTPIGNLGDLSPRAVGILTSVERILAEDTRRTRVLAQHAGAHAPLVSLHAHNEAERTERVLGWLEAGESLALVSDAGTPLVSDPGLRLVAAVAAAGHDIVPVPGPSAVLAALVGSGLPTQRFAFLGFPERKGKERARLLRRVATSEETVVLFESPQRLEALLVDLTEACGPDREVAVARELTKIHEEFVRGTLQDTLERYRAQPARGEVTVVVGPAGSAHDEVRSEQEVRELARSLLEQGLRASEVARELSRHAGIARNTAYRIVQDLSAREG